MNNSLNWKRKPKLKANTEISLTPLVDTALTLVVILMVTTTPLVNSILSISQSLKSYQGICQVAIDRNEQIFVDNNQVDFSNLDLILKEKIGENREVPVSINVDNLANYETFFKVYNKVLSVGPKRVTFTKM